MTEAEQFYLQRDSRTALYVGGRAISQLPVNVFIGPAAAETPAGQACVLALANQLSRIHRNVRFILSAQSTALIVPALFAGTTLADTLVQTASNIDPYGAFSASAPPHRSAISIGIGEDISKGLDWYIGAAGAIATLDRNSHSSDFSDPGTIRGAALASCLGAAAIFRSVLGLPTASRTVSAWNYCEGDLADPGPPTIFPLDIGNTLLVGAGAVGSCLIYWLHLFGVRGQWVIIDGDRVDLSNTNRQILFTPSHAGWRGKTPLCKAVVASQYLPNSQPCTCLYHHCAEIKETKFDVILALANEHDVRTRLAQRKCAVILHATTGENWLSELHRHILGRDDCLRCRNQDIKAPTFGCSTSSLPTALEPSAPDAALPFLSAASGLMLATALHKLQHGDLGDGAINNWRWDFESSHKMASSGIRKCGDDCHIIPPAPLRHKLNKGTRWAHLIP